MPYGDDFYNDEEYWNKYSLTSPSSTTQSSPTDYYGASFNPNNTFWSTPSTDTSRNYYDLTPSVPSTDYYGPSFNPSSSFWNTGSVQQSPLNMLYTAPQTTPATGGFGGTGLDPSVAVAPTIQKEEEELPWWRKGFLPNVTPGQANMLKLGAGVLEFLQKRQQAKELNQAAARMDPFSAQRPFYQEKLQQTYTDPNAYMNTPEARLQQEALKQELARRDAKAGRRSQYGARAIELAQAQAKQLAAYRNALLQPAGAGIMPGGGDLASQAARAKLESLGAITTPLQDAITGRDSRYTAVKSDLDTLKKAFGVKG